MRFSTRAGSIHKIGWCVSENRLHGQLLAATTTTGSQHAAAVLGGHTGTEAVHLAALTLLGLVSTEHYNTTPLANFMYGVAYFYSTQNTTKQLH
mgnify:CR=1 FL=1